MQWGVRALCGGALIEHHVIESVHRKLEAMVDAGSVEGVLARALLIDRDVIIFAHGQIPPEEIRLEQFIKVGEGGGGAREEEGQRHARALRPVGQHSHPPAPVPPHAQWCTIARSEESARVHAVATRECARALRECQNRSEPERGAYGIHHTGTHQAQSRVRLSWQLGKSETKKVVSTPGSSGKGAASPGSGTIERLDGTCTASHAPTGATPRRALTGSEGMGPRESRWT